MKKRLLASVSTLVFLSCNFSLSDHTEDLPSGYQFIFEGGNLNMVLRDNNVIIDSGAVDYSFDGSYIYFSADTTYSEEASKISKKNLKYYIHSIEKDTLSKALNYESFCKFIKKNKINSDIDISRDTKSND